MEEKKYEIIIRERAKIQINQIYNYIASEGYPLNGSRFIERLITSIYNLETFPQVYSLCRARALARYHWHCATFEDNYIIAFKMVKSKIIIMRVIHSKRLK